ncbi:hypothetical protein GCM10020001_095030 [Nonomuraea salmonea]
MVTTVAAPVAARSAAVHVPRSAVESTHNHTMSQCSSRASLITSYGSSRSCTGALPRLSRYSEPPPQLSRPGRTRYPTLAPPAASRTPNTCPNAPAPMTSTFTMVSLSIQIFG